MPSPRVDLRRAAPRHEARARDIPRRGDATQADRHSKPHQHDAGGCIRHQRRHYQPAPARLSAVNVAKRKTTGWRDEGGDFVPHYFVRRSCDPERPAWIPVAHGEALARIAAGKAAGGSVGGRRKVTVTHVVEALTDGPMCRQDLIAHLMCVCSCSDRPARGAIRDAEDDEVISSFTADNPRGGNPIKWLCLSCRHQVTG